MSISPEDRVLDWAPRPDPRSANYPARAAFRRVNEVVNWTWRTPFPLDQGREGACVGFGWTHEALCTPVPVDFSRLKNKQIPTNPDTFARTLYREAQHVDEWGGNAYEGTSVNAGAKIMRERGLLGEWLWNFNADDVMLSIPNLGPVVLGINWYESMYEAPNGILSVGGSLAGGHCIIAPATRKAGMIFPDEPAVGLLNSWGPSWGKNGLAWMRRSTLQRLMSENGEAAVPVRRSYGR